MKHFRLVDNVMGWLAFLVAAIVYCSTVEPTASFWDCPEFITTGYKLEVGHPPGAPFFMLTANLFSQFASDPTQVAYMVNIMSALLSALTILFLFWSVSHLARRLLVKNDSEITLAKLITIEAAALVGALIYTFSDTFWYCAVEGEVYAYSSAFTAVVFWLILKWEDNADNPHSDRWLVLIMYMTGLSIGVHLLNLLCVPAIVLVYYYRKFPHKTGSADLKGSLIALAVSVVILAAVLYGVVPGIVKVGGWFELFFVNTLGMPFNSGVIVYIAVLVAIMIWAIWETYQSNNRTRSNIAFTLSIAMLGIPFYGHGWASVFIGIIVIAILLAVLFVKRKGGDLLPARVKNTVMLCMLMLTVGYSSYAVIVIRSSANPPMDQNSPEDIFTLGEYLGREQYGTRPLFRGQMYTSQVALESDGRYCKPVLSKGANVWARKEKKNAEEKDEYFVVRTNDEYVYAQNMLFPRMYSSNHAASYEGWVGKPDGRTVTYDRCGENVKITMPSMFQNLEFFVKYQCQFMYWRYFMWNFAGRQNDLQGHGELEHGNWITGFSFIDNAMYGNQELLPDDLKNNKGHNVYYCLPLLLGLIGLFWQAFGRGQKGIRQFWVVFFLFFMTGLAIVIYLNQTPGQPRERDYAYAASFYAFSIWCGLGVAALITMLSDYLKKYQTAIASAVGVVCLLVPVQMASQNWDDHDRSGRYMARDFGQNYLMSLDDERNPIIYTNGDNDTFPLWYNQDTEGVRTDARVCNLSYLQTDWYIDQMRRPAYDSPAVPITWKRYEYCAGTNDYVRVNPGLKTTILSLYQKQPELMKEHFGENPFELKNILKIWVRNDVSPETMDVMRMMLGSETQVIPTDELHMTIDSAAVAESGMLKAAAELPDHMTISLKGKNALYKGDLMMLEMIAQCNWRRPIYVALTVGAENYMNLGDNFVQEGLVNRITPYTTNVAGASNYDLERCYTNLMTRFKFGGLETPGLYLDETITRMCYTHRRIYMQLAKQLLIEGDKERAQKVVDYAALHIPEYNLPACFDSGSNEQAEINYLLGNKQEARRLMDALWLQGEQYMRWYSNLPSRALRASSRDANRHLYFMRHLLSVAYQHDEEWLNEHHAKYAQVIETYQRNGGSVANW